MKKKLLAVVCALALCVSSVGCTISTPSTVGTIGDVEITAGIYLLSQYQAYQIVVGYANSTQSSMTVKEFLKETVYLTDDGEAAPEPEEGEEQTGTAHAVSDLIAEETLLNVQYYAAIETMFAELGGELTAEEIASAEEYAEYLYEYDTDLYEGNGIGLTTLKTYQITSAKASALLTMIYGTDGTEAIDEATLTDYLQNDMYYLQYTSVPLYNTSTYSFAGDEETQLVLDALDAAIADYNAAMNGTEADDEVDDEAEPDNADATAEVDDTAETDATDEIEDTEEVEDSTIDAALSAADTFYTALSAHIEDAYAVMENTYDVTDLADSLYTELLTLETLESNFTDDTLDSLTGLGLNEAVAISSGSFSAMVFLRLDPLADGYTLDHYLSDILIDLKSDELVERLETSGAALTSNLDTDAMSKFPTSKIVLSTLSSYSYY